MLQTKKNVLIFRVNKSLHLQCVSNLTLNDFLYPSLILKKRLNLGFLCYFMAMMDISTFTYLGKVATATHSLAGAFFSSK